MCRDLDLVQLLGLPERLPCPVCGQRVATNFDRVDLALEGDANPAAGVWRLPVWCEGCTHQWVFACTLSVIAEG